MRRVAATAAVVLLVLLAIPTRASAATATEVGWWSSSPVASAPEGGVAVQAAPDGSAISVAAVRVALTGRTLTSAALTMAEAGGVGASNAALRVCRSSNSWRPASPGPLDDAPMPECANGQAKLERNPTTAVWAADVRGLLQQTSGSTVSLVILPASAGAVPVGFEVQLTRPEVRAEISPDSTADPETGSSGSDATPPGEGFSGSTGYEPGEAEATAGGFELPVTTPPEADPGIDASVGAALELPDDEGVAIGLPSSGTRRTGREPIPVMRAVLFVVIAAAVGVAAGVANRMRGLAAP